MIGKLLTQLLVDVLGKKPSTTFVVIDEVDTDNWGIAGETIKRHCKGFNISLTRLCVHGSIRSGYGKLHTEFQILLELID